MASSANPTRDDFAALLTESLGNAESLDGRVVKGTVTAIENDMAVIDVGLKSEGRVALREFAAPGQKADLKVGDEVEVYLDRIENALGEAVISRDKARREESWVKLEKAFEANEKVNGVIFNIVKGGYTVDLDGATAWSPALAAALPAAASSAPETSLWSVTAIAPSPRSRAVASSTSTGPKAVQALERVAPGVAALTFMKGGLFKLDGVDAWISRSGYTGEDGFELSVRAEHAEDLAHLLLAHEEVAPAGLGARDALRLEAGLPFELVRTETFTVLAVCQWFNVLNCRSASGSVFTTWCSTSVSVSPWNGGRPVSIW